MNCSPAIISLCAIALFLFAPLAQASTSSIPEKPFQNAASTDASVAKSRPTRNRSREHQEAPSQPQPAVSVPPSEPPIVTLQHGTLTVSAHNSDLSQILNDVEQSGGMTISGAIQNVKVFGQYGPGNSNDVLTDLLTGLGYNFIMIGETDQGAPKKLLLTPRTASATPPEATPSTASKALNSDGTVADGEHLGPGAIVNVPPPPSDDAQERAQQHLERLQKMHETKLPEMPTAPQ